jgi:hypothetical protein
MRLAARIFSPLVATSKLQTELAIAKLPPAPIVEANLSATTHEAAAASTERRQLTVMYCDLVGSIALLSSTPRTCGASLPPSPVLHRTGRVQWWLRRKIY